MTTHSDGRREPRPVDIDPYTGPTEDESLAAIGTSREEIERLAEGWGMPSGLDDNDDASDPLDDFVDGSTSEEFMVRVKHGMQFWSADTPPEVIAAATIAGQEQPVNPDSDNGDPGVDPSADDSSLLSVTGSLVTDNREPDRVSPDLGPDAGDDDWGDPEIEAMEFAFNEGPGPMTPPQPTNRHGANARFDEEES